MISATVIASLSALHSAVGTFRPGFASAHPGFQPLFLDSQQARLRKRACVSFIALSRRRDQPAQALYVSCLVPVRLPGFGVLLFARICPMSKFMFSIGFWSCLPSRF